MESWRPVSWEFRTFLFLSEKVWTILNQLPWIWTEIHEMYSLDCMVIDLIESQEKVTVFLSVVYDWVRNTWHTKHYIQNTKSAWSLHEISSINLFKSSCPMKHTGWVVLITSCYQQMRAKPLCHSVTKIVFNTYQCSPVNLWEKPNLFTRQLFKHIQSRSSYKNPSLQLWSVKHPTNPNR